VNYFSVTSSVQLRLNAKYGRVRGSALPNRRRAAVSIRPDGRILEIFEVKLCFHPKYFLILAKKSHKI
jgi:hypothetical protein